MPLISHFRHIIIAVGCLVGMNMPATAQNAIITSSDSVAAAGCHIVEALANNNIADWSNVTVPVKLTLTTDRGPVSLSGRMTMVRDRSIYISLRFWGFEVAQLNVTSDSVVAVMKRPNKAYVSERIEKYMHGLNLGISTFQDLLIGRIVNTDGQLLTPANAQGAAASFDEILGTWSMQDGISRDDYSLRYDVAAAPEPHATAVVVTPAGHAQARLEYSRHQDSEYGPLAGEASIAFDIKGRRCSIAAEMQWGKAKWNQASVPAFNTDLEGYQRLDLAKLLTLVAGAAQ